MGDLGNNKMGIEKRDINRNRDTRGTIKEELGHN
jgi:hypothetical protein